MRQLSTDHLTAWLEPHEPPCISLYQPTHRSHPDNQQDPIRYRNLVRELESSLLAKYPKRDLRQLLERFQDLARDDDFWNHRTEGLAILGAPGTFEIFELQRPVRELIVVADSFHTKPMLRVLQSADRYQILCLNRHEAKLYEGNRDALDPIELTDVPATITQALGGELSEPHQTVASYGFGPGGPRSARGERGMHHGHGQKKDEVEIDMVRFFRAIDRAILERYSRPSGLPLMLAALKEYHGPFHEVSHNPHLMDDGIERNPDELDLEQLRMLAWEKVEPVYLARLAGLVESYESARSRQLGSDDIGHVAEAAIGGRVGTLLVEAERVIPGRLDPASGRVEPGDLADPEVDDLLDDLAEAVLRRKGEVVVVPTERMPSGTGVAATYRF